MIPTLPPISALALIAINPHMVVIQVHIGRNLVDDVLLGGGSKANIITKDLRKRLGLPFPKLVPCMLQMVYQSLTKLIGIIRDLKIHTHGIPYIAIFTMMQNNVLDGSYSMLFGLPWLKNAKVIHNWGKNLITIEGNGVIRMIPITKHLDANIKRPEVFLCYDFANGITNEEEEIFLHAKPKLFNIRTITLLELRTLVSYIPLETSLEELKFDFLHTLGGIPVDEVFTHLKMQDLKIARWTLQDLFTLSYTPGSMKCDSRASLLVCTFTSPCLGHEPKARVVTILIFKLGLASMASFHSFTYTSFFSFN